MPTINLDTDTSLQSAIDAASSGDIIVLSPGIHYGTANVTKPLTIRGFRNRRGNVPILQVDQLVDDWTLVNESLNIWRRVFNGETIVQSLFVNGRSISVIQNTSSDVSSARLEEARSTLFATAWDVTDYTLPDTTGTPIAFWDYYDGIGSIQSNGTVELRLKNGVNPNTAETRIRFDNTPALTIGTIGGGYENCTVENLEIRGGNSAITATLSNGLRIGNCRIACMGQFPIFLKQCLNVRVHNNEITSAPSQSNIGGGGGGTTPLARANQFAYLLRKAFTNTQGDTLNAGVKTSGTSSVIVENNNVHQMSQAINCESSSTFTIRNNRIAYMLSLGILSSSDSVASVENNRIHECNIGIRLELLGSGSGRTFTMRRNRSTFDGLAAADGGRHFLFHVSTKPYSVENQITVEENLFQGGSFGIAPPDTTGVIPDGHTTAMPNGQWNDNVWDCAVVFPGTVGTIGLGAVEDNWFGGTLPAAVLDSAWWQAATNNYTPGQRLVSLSPPVGFEASDLNYVAFTGLQRMRQRSW